MVGGYVSKFTKNPNPGCYAQLPQPKPGTYGEGFMHDDDGKLILDENGQAYLDKPKTLRTRSAKSMPSNGGAACPHNKEEVECDIPGCKVDCQMSEWGSWGACSTSCLEDGVKTRTRHVNAAPEWGGAACSNPTEVVPCTTVAECLAVDCGYSAWSAWGPCALSCGGDSEKGRVRTIVTAAQGIGKPCYDEIGTAIGISETSHCTSPACPARAPAPSSPTLACGAARLRMREGAQVKHVATLAESSDSSLGSPTTTSGRMGRVTTGIDEAVDHGAYSVNTSDPNFNAGGIIIPTFDGADSDYHQWDSTSKAWVPCSDIKCKDGDCGDGNRYVDGNANGNGPGVYFVDSSGFGDHKMFKSWGIPSNFGVATMRCCTAWFLGARYSNGFMSAVTDVKWDKGPLTKDFANQNGGFAAMKQKATGQKSYCQTLKKHPEKKRLCEGMGYVSGKVMLALKKIAQFIWQVVIFITKIVFMVLMWLEIKVQNANVYDLYIGAGKKGIRGDTPGINHTPTTGGFFSSAWKEHFAPTGNMGDMEDAYNGGKGPAAAASVDSCVPKAATPPIEWWRGWNSAYGKEGWKYLSSCRGPIKEKTITYTMAATAAEANAAADSKTYSRPVKITSYSGDSAFGWGFGNNNYPKFQAYLFPTCFTINKAWIFGQIFMNGGMDREMYGAKSFAAFFMKIADKSTKEASKDCFKGKMGNKWRYNGEREYNPSQGTAMGEGSPGPENTIKPATVQTATTAAAVKSPAQAGSIVTTQATVNKKACKESSFYKDATGQKKWPLKFVDVMTISDANKDRMSEAGGGIMQWLGLWADPTRQKMAANAGSASGGNTIDAATKAANWDAAFAVSEGGYDGVDPGANPENPSVCAPHAPYAYTANWGPASWNYNTIKMSRGHSILGNNILGNNNPLLSNPISGGDNAKEFSDVEAESKYINWARNQNNNGIFPGKTGYNPEMTRTEFDAYVQNGGSPLPTDDASAAASSKAAAMLFAGRNKKVTPSQNGSGAKTEEVAALSFKFYTDDSDPENRIITPLTKEDVLKKKKYRYSMRAGEKSAKQRELGSKNRQPSTPGRVWLIPGSGIAQLVGSLQDMAAGPGGSQAQANKFAAFKDDAVKWNYKSDVAGEALRLCVGGMLKIDPVVKATAKKGLAAFVDVTVPDYQNRKIGVDYSYGDRCMGLAVIDMRPTAAGAFPHTMTMIGGALYRNSGLSNIEAFGAKIAHYRQRKAQHETTAKITISKVQIDKEVLSVFKAIPNAPGYGGGHKATSCMKVMKSIFGKDCKTWMQPIEVVLSKFICDDMSFGIVIRSGPIGCATPYLTSVSPKVDEYSGKTRLIGADLAFPFTVSLSFKFWLKSSWYVCIMVPLLLWAIELLLKAIGVAAVPFPYNLIELEVGFSVAWHDWGKSAKDNAADGEWYLKFCFQDPVMGPMTITPLCDTDAIFSAPKAGASCPTEMEVKCLEVNPQLSVALSMKLLGVCSFCGKMDLDFWQGTGGLPNWNCMKVGMIVPAPPTGAGSAPSALVRNADGDCQGVTVSLGKSVGRTGRARMAYAKQARCALEKDSCHDALESKDTSALAACLKDALSSRIQCDATARLDPYPSIGNLFAKEMDVFMGPNMGPDSATSMASLRAGYAQGLGSLRVERLSVQLTGSESDVKLRMNATVAPATAVQLRDVCWNWDDHMMKDVRHAKADKYTTAKQKGRFLVAAVQWHLKNGSGLDQKTRENMQDWVVMVKDMGAMGFLQKDPSVESREANTLSAHTSKMCSKLPLTGLRAELQMDVTSLGSGETAGQFSGSLRKFTVPLVEQAYHRTTQAQRAVESMLGGKRRFADVFGKIMREAKNIVDKEAQYLMKATCTELRVLCPTCSDEAWECGL